MNYCCEKKCSGNCAPGSISRNSCFVNGIYLKIMFLKMRIKVSGQTATPQSRKLFYCSSSENHSLLVRRANGAEYKSNATTDTSFVWQQQQQRRSVHTSIRLQKHVVSVFPFNFQLEHCNELFQFVGCPSLYPCSNFFPHHSLLHRKTWSPATDIPLRRTT